MAAQAATPWVSLAASNCLGPVSFLNTGQYLLRPCSVIPQLVQQQCAGVQLANILINSVLQCKPSGRWTEGAVLTLPCCAVLYAGYAVGFFQGVFSVAFGSDYM